MIDDWTDDQYKVIEATRWWGGVKVGDSYTVRQLQAQGFDTSTIDEGEIKRHLGTIRYEKETSTR